MKTKFAIISGYGALPNCPVDLCGRTPRLISGETSQGVLNATYIPHRTRSEVFDRQSFSWVSLKQLLYVHGHRFDAKLIPFKGQRTPLCCRKL
jgi:hypothetical protein